MSQLLSRADIIAGLADIAELLVVAEVEVTFHVVGGAALVLTVRPDRQATGDVDTWINTTSGARTAVDDAIIAVARRRGWTDDWLNDKARLFIPNDVGGDIGEWLPHHLTNRIRIVIARPDVLLAMKLRAGRGRRDSDDLPALVEACGYTTRAQAEACFAEHYPDDAMKPKSQAWIEANLE